MTKARTLSKLLGGTVPSALDTLNEIATALGNDASLASTITNALATKQASLGYTPVNKAGDTMTGNLTLNGKFALSAELGDTMRSGTFLRNNQGSADVSRWTEKISSNSSTEVEFYVYLGTGPANYRRYWNLVLPTGVSTWMEYMRVEVFEGNWSYGQQVGYKEFFVTAASNSWSVALNDSYNRANFENVNMHATPNGTTSVKIGGSNIAGANALRYKITSARSWVSNDMTMYFNTDTPF